MGRALRVNTAELMRRPGSDRQLDAVATVTDLGIEHDAYDPDGEVTVSLHLESTNDALVVRGRLELAWHGTCRRCATPVGGMVVSDVDELYQLQVTDPDAFPLPADQLDLEPMVREVLLIDAPAAPLCRADCAGLCPVCGVDRNTERCSCVAVAVDDRWSALEALKHQLGEVADRDR
jgi:uncharacterized protein